MEFSLPSPTTYFQYKDMNIPRLPVLFSPTPNRRTQSTVKNCDSRFVLSNSIDEPVLSSEIRKSNSPRKPRNLKSLNIETPVIDELNLAIKYIISNKPRISKSPLRKATLYSVHFAKNNEETDVNGFIQALFTHEPSPYRKVGLTSEPEALDIRAAEKILQDAKKIIKHGVVKKSIQYEKVTLIEEFWKNQISKEKTERWDIFEEALLTFFDNYMVCNYGSLRKLNWKKLFSKLYSKISIESDEVSMWPMSPSRLKPPKYSVRVVKFTTFANFIANSELHKIMLGCIEEIPFYIENLRKGTSYSFSCGCFYKGEWKEGRKEGSGTMDFCSGEQYVGHFNRGFREDYGTLIGNNYIYKGDFKKDKFHGYGKIKFPDRSIYEGLWVKNDLSNGKYEIGDGTFYVGEWYKSTYEGKGKLVLPDGTKKKGMWKGGRLCGEGSVKYPDSTVLRGFFVDDILQGEPVDVQDKDDDD